MIQALARTARHEDAERVARTITDKQQQTEALITVAQSLASHGHPEDAERLAGTLFEYQRSKALRRIAHALANSGRPEEANRVAYSIASEYERTKALDALARGIS